MLEHRRRVKQRFSKYYLNLVRKIEEDLDAVQLEYTQILTALQMAYDENLQEELILGINAFYNYLRIKGEYDKAERYLIAARKASESLGDASRQAQILGKLSSIEGIKGHATRAIELLRTALELAQDARDKQTICALLILLGAWEDRQGRFTKAQEYYEQGLNLARELKDYKRVVDFIHNLGALQSDRGAFEEAINLWAEGLKIAREHNYGSNISYFLLNIGVVKAHLGHLSEAKEYLAEALTIASEMGDRERILQIKVNQSGFNTMEGRFADAEKSYQESYNLAKQLGHIEGLSFILGGLIGVASNLGYYEQAEAYFIDSMVIAHTMGHSYLKSALMTEWGNFCINQDKLSAAKVVSRRAYEVAENAALSEQAAKALFNLAQVAHTQGDFTEAREMGNKALLLFEQQRYHLAPDVKDWLANLSEDILTDSEAAQITVEDKRQVTPRIQYGAIERALIHIVNTQNDSNEIDWPGFSMSTVVKALRSLEDLGFILREGKHIQVQPMGLEFVRNPENRLVIFSVRAIQIETFAIFVNLLKSQQASDLSRTQLSIKLKKTLNTPWNVTTAKFYAKIMLNWTRNTIWID